MDRDTFREMVQDMPEYRDGRLTDEQVEEIVDYMEAHKDGFLNAEIEALVRRELIRKEAQGEFRYDPETGDYHRVRKPEQE